MFSPSLATEWIELKLLLHRQRRFQANSHLGNVMRMDLISVNELRIWKCASDNLCSSRGVVFATRAAKDLKFSLAFWRYNLVNIRTFILTYYSNPFTALFFLRRILAETNITQNYAKKGICTLKIQCCGYTLAWKVKTGSSSSWSVTVESVGTG